MAQLIFITPPLILVVLVSLSLIPSKMYDKCSFFSLYSSCNFVSCSVSVPILSSRNLFLVFCTGSSGDCMVKE